MSNLTPAQQDLVHQATQGNAVAVRTLLDEGVDMNAPEQREHFNPSAPYTEITPCPALYAAVEAGQTHIVRLLIESGADIHAPIEKIYKISNTSIKTFHHTLARAAYHGYLDIAKLLVDAGATSEQGRWESLRNAATGGEGDHVLRNKCAVFQYLVKTFDVDLSTNNASLPVFAANSNNIPVLEYLLDNGASPNAQGGNVSPLDVAAFAGHNACVQLLLSHGANVNEPSILEGALYRFKSFSFAGSAPPAQFLEVITTLVDAGAPYTDKMCTEAIESCHYDAVFPILLKRQDEIMPALTEMMKAACDPKTGHVEKLEFMLELGADISTLPDVLENIVKLYNGTDKDKFVQKLLDLGMDPNARDGAALIHAVPEKRALSNPNAFNILDLLIKHGGNIHHQGMLLKLIEINAADVLTDLVRKGADLSGLPVQSLRKIADHDHDLSLKLLLSSGFDPRQRDEHGQTLRDYCEQAAREDLLQPIDARIEALNAKDTDERMQANAQNKALLKKMARPRLGKRTL